MARCDRIPGGTGLIGRAVVALLAEQGARVTVYDLNHPTPETMDDGVETRIAGSVVDGHDALVHLAGLAGPGRGTPEEIYATNALGTFTVMEAAARAGVAKLVYDVPREPVSGRDVPVNLHRATTHLGFKASLALEDLGPDLLVDLDEVNASNA